MIYFSIDNNTKESYKEILVNKEDSIFSIIRKES